MGEADRKGGVASVGCLTWEVSYNVGTGAPSLWERWRTVVQSSLPQGLSHWWMAIPEKNEFPIACLLPASL